MVMVQIRERTLVSTFSRLHSQLDQELHFHRMDYLKSRATESALEDVVSEIERRKCQGETITQEEER